MRLLVADASALVEYLLGTTEGKRIATAVEHSDGSLFVPELCDVEVTAALRRAVALRRLSPARAREALDDYTALPLERYRHTPLVLRLWELRANFSSYDATYVALAELLGADLLTADRRLGLAVARHTDVQLA